MFTKSAFIYVYSKKKKINIVKCYYNLGTTATNWQFWNRNILYILYIFCRLYIY